VLDVVAARAPDGFRRLEDVITREEIADIVGGYARMAGFADTRNFSAKDGTAPGRQRLKRFCDG
jgi:hypothetical protein